MPAPILREKIVPYISPHSLSLEDALLKVEDESKGQIALSFEATRGNLMCVPYDGKSGWTRRKPFVSTTKAEELVEEIQRTNDRDSSHRISKE